MPVTLTLPTVSSTVGPTYATQINAALTTLAAATHTGGANGDQWTAASLGIDGNVSWAGYSITALKAAAFTAQAANITDTYRLWCKTDGNLYYTNGSGTAVQITASGTLNTSALITAVYSTLFLAGNVTIGPTDSATIYFVNTASARTITLPAASAVQPGRYYIFTDATGGASSNAITINRAGSDTIEGGTSWTIDRAYGTARLVSDGTSKWTVITEHDATTSEKGRVKLAGDLGGTAALPTVVGLTGSSGVVNFGASVSGPTIGQADASGIPVNMTIRAQAAGGASNVGGNLLLEGGANTGSARPGGVQISSSVGTVGVEVGAFSGTRRFVALGTNPSTTDIPTGDKVVYIAEAATTPTSSPVGGGVLFVQSGALYYKGTSGTVTPVGAA